MIKSDRLLLQIAGLLQTVATFQEIVISKLINI